MEEVFKALADASRRRLLDALRLRDGQSLAQLSSVLPVMTRYGVSAHLGVLEKAGLVSTVRHGRFKLHYLNVLPLVRVQERWLSSYTQATAQALITFQTRLEDQQMTNETVAPPTTVFTIYIATPRQRVWDALTEVGTPRGWLYGSITRSDWRPGERYAQSVEGFALIDGEVLRCEEPSRLVLGFDAHWDDHVEAEPAGVLDYQLDEVGEDVTRLTVTLTDLVGHTATAVERDTPVIYSSLKSFLETGRAFSIA